MIKVGSRWRHADGGSYKVITLRGQVKVGKSKWYPVVGYVHDDGTLGNDPYYTDAKRFMRRFEAIAEE